jgi:diadenosine tetraphosphate (Ap4A) HIT family hydrolase
MSCIFCEISKDRIIIENELAYAIYDGFPVSPGHCLIIPKRHFPDFFNSTKEEKTALFDLLEFIKEKIEQQFHPDGFNIGVNVGAVSGQTVMHLHIHLIPRYRGDVADPRGGVRGVIPEKQKY